LNKISESLTTEQISTNFIPLITKLAKERWFSLHIAATGLFNPIIARVDDLERLSLLKLYSDLVHDDSPMARKAAAKKLPELIDILAEKHLIIANETSESEENLVIWNLLTNMYESLVNDHQDSVKFLSVDILISVLKFVKSTNNPFIKSQITDLFNSLTTLINDPSWRVRYMVADRFVSLSANFNNVNMEDNFILKLVPYIVSLMKDNEAEVRKAISKQLPGFSKLINENDSTNTLVLKEIVPIVNQLSLDESENVRSALASEITCLAPILGKDLTIDYLLPIFVEMLKDEFSDVRLNIISNLKIVNDVIGIELLSESLMPAITALANDKLWRVRLAIIEKILQKKQSNSKDFNNFICRITCLFTFDNLISVVSKETTKEYLYPFINDLANDRVPNIRFNVARSLLNVSKALLPEYKSLVESDIQTTLETLLSKDPDTDVRFFANDSLTKLKEML